MRILKTLQETREILVDTVHQLAIRGTLLARLTNSSDDLVYTTDHFVERARALETRRACTWRAVVAVLAILLFLTLMWASYIFNTQK